jgi:hypothetical protein
MARFGKVVVAAMSAMTLVAAGAATVLAHDRHTILEFDAMRPVVGAQVGTVNHRGLTGGGLPWAIKSARGEVDKDGHVQVKVRGLVIPVAPFNGTNPVPFFKAVVSCVTAPGVFANVSTGMFPADSAGNSMIDDTVTLPSVCKHPVVFVTSPTGSWFSKTNSNADEDDD